MAKVRVRINSSDAKALLNSEGVQQLVLAHAESIADNANSQLKPRSKSAGRFEADVQAGGGRAHARVTTAGVYPIRHNLKHNTLLKAVGSG